MPILFSEYSCLFSAIQFTLPFQKKGKKKGKGKREGRKREKKRITLEWALISYVTRYLRQSVIKTGAWYPYFRSQKPIQKNPTFSKREFSINTLIIYCFTCLSFVKVFRLMRLNRLENRITKSLALTCYLYLNIDKDATRVCIAYMSSCFVLVGREGIWERGLSNTDSYGEYCHRLKNSSKSLTMLWRPLMDRSNPVAKGWPEPAGPTRVPIFWRFDTGLLFSYPIRRSFSSFDVFHNQRAYQLRAASVAVFRKVFSEGSVNKSMS